MASVRQETEQYGEAMVSCLAEFGVTGIVSIGGRVGTGGMTNEDGNQPPGAAEIQEAAAEACNDRVPLPAVWTAPANSETYERVLEVRSCLIAHGVDVPEAPSEETWIERANQEDYWTPYKSIFGPDDTLLFSDQELSELNENCPQYGPGGVSVIPESAFS